jgi:hypothetical protein
MAPETRVNQVRDPLITPVGAVKTVMHLRCLPDAAHLAQTERTIRDTGVRFLRLTRRHGRGFRADHDLSSHV